MHLPDDGIYEDLKKGGRRCGGLHELQQVTGGQWARQNSLGEHRSKEGRASSQYTQSGKFEGV